MYTCFFLLSILISCNVDVYLSLVQAGIPDPPAMSADLIRQKARERHFLEQLLDSRKLENYNIPVPINAELRKYQQVGYLSPLP